MRAPAKLNLSLEVLGRRPDGFHEVRTVLTTIRLSDVIDFFSLDSHGGAAAPIEVSRVTGPAAKGVPLGEGNLVARVLGALQQESGSAKGASVRLHKRIPSQAGLGGGSSDAAAALLAANRAWSLGWGVGRLSQLAARIGSDLPFFVAALSSQMGSRGRGFAACCTGRGEEVRPIRSIGGAPCVIVMPEFGLSTRDVYKARSRAGYDKTDDASDARVDESARVEASLVRGDRRGVARVLGNGLMAAAAEVEPRLERIAAAFARLPVLAHQLSGSGSAYYGLCETWSHVRRVAATLRGRRLGDVLVTATC